MQRSTRHATEAHSSTRPLVANTVIDVAKRARRCLRPSRICRGLTEDAVRSDNRPSPNPYKTHEFVPGHRARLSRPSPFSSRNHLHLEVYGVTSDYALFDRYRLCHCRWAASRAGRVETALSPTYSQTRGAWHSFRGLVISGCSKYTHASAGSCFTTTARRVRAGAWKPGCSRCRKCAPHAV